MIKSGHRPRVPYALSHHVSAGEIPTASQAASAQHNTSAIKATGRASTTPKWTALGLQQNLYLGLNFDV